MLQLAHVSKSYTTGTFTQIALDDVSLAFRDNEFVSILGPSGSGKTTLLNVIGGLDHFDSGDLIIDGVSTAQYDDRDWDTYRNNRIGFVFQSYNLIPHQTVLANVELALTLSGVSPQERRRRAVAALADVGLAEHQDKRPSQLSGGQMQRVALARALINDPEILLADEPTGALDSKTSVQVMDLLREVAEDRLVIMVTHNPELAVQYSTRIVELADGKIRSDTDPYFPTRADMRRAKAVRETQMGFLTALTLSFNNLMTKKGRTLMTAFAGSIGIIGIAAILALANGVNAYIQEVEEKTLSAYPLQIMSSGFDMTSMIVDVQSEAQTAEEKKLETPESGEIHESRVVTTMFGRVGKNDLAALKEYLDSDGGGVTKYVQAIEYRYNITPQIFHGNDDGSYRQVNPDHTFDAFGMGDNSSSSMMGSAFSTNVFFEMPSDTSLFDSQYDILAGGWPTSEDELVLVLTRSGSVTDFISYAMGLRDAEELERMVNAFTDQTDIEVPQDERDYALDDLLGVTFKVVPASSLFAHEADFDVWTSKTDDEAYMKDLLDGAKELKIVGVVKPKDDVDATTLTQGIGYTPDLTSWLMGQSASSEIVQRQIDNPDVNVLSGKSFDEEAEDSGQQLDLSSFFSIDETKMASAFVIDPDALDLSSLDLASAFDLSSMMGSMDLSTMMGSMDLSSLDLSSMMGSMDLAGVVSALDLSQMPMADLMPALSVDLAGLDLTGIDLEGLFDNDLRELLGPTFTLDPKTLFEGVDMTSTVDFVGLTNDVNAILLGLPTYLEARVAAGMGISEMKAAVEEYFGQNDVGDMLRAAVERNTHMSEAARTRLTENIRKQIMAGTDDPARLAAVDEVQRQVVERIVEAVGDRVATSLANVFSTEVIRVVTTTVSQTLETVLSQVIGAFMQSMMESFATQFATQFATAFTSQMEGAMTQLMANMAGSIHVDEAVFAEAFSFNMSEEEMANLFAAMMTTERTSYDANMTKLGYAEESKPFEIDIYPKNFDDKTKITEILDAYNDEMRTSDQKDKVITYTDLVGALMSSVTDIVNMISYVLIAFVAISLVVSSIMIGVITYISVLERKKEIGILRSIGASKRDISRVFNAETVIEGLVSGIMGVGITFIGTIPANIIVESAFGVHRVARLPLLAAIVLIGVSVALSFIAGLIPALKAAKADPVEALRSE